MGAVLKKRHVLQRHDAGHNPFVPVTTGHFVPRLDFALHGDKDLNHLHHAWLQIIPALQFIDLIVKSGVDFAQAGFKFLIQGGDAVHDHGILNHNFGPLVFGHGVQRGGIQSLSPFGACGFFHNLTRQPRGQTVIIAGFNDPALRIPLPRQGINAGLLQRHGPLVLVNTGAGENPHLNHRPRHPGRQAQGCVAHIAGFFPENGSQQFFLRG